MVSGPSSNWEYVSHYLAFQILTDDSQIEIEYDYMGVPEHQKETAKVLFETIGQIIGRSTRTKLSLSSNFYALGGNSLNSIFTVAELRKKGYFVSITFFIAAANLGQILAKICETTSFINQESLYDDLKADTQMGLQAVPLAKEHRDETIEWVLRFFPFWLNYSICISFLLELSRLVSLRRPN